MNLTDPNDTLSRTLATWRVNPPPQPDFRPAVWRRIHPRSAETWVGYLRGHLLGWSLVAGFAVVAAGWTGHSVARARLETGREQMVVSYLGNLDPRVLASTRR